MADNNISLQGLEFQIVNDSNDAVNGLDRLTKKLEELRTGTAGEIGRAHV